MTQGPHPRDADLTAFTEGRLSGEPLHRLEEDLRASRELRERLDALHAADESLRRLFAAPAEFDLRGLATDRSPGRSVDSRDEADRSGLPASRPGRSPWPARFRSGGLAAAAVVLLLVAAWRLNSYFNPPHVPAYPMTPVSIYDRLVAQGFTPEWVCKDDAEFIDTVKEAVGEPLLARSAGATEIVGWAYTGGLKDLGLSADARLLLARVDGQPVLVFLDRAGPRCRFKFTPPLGRELRVFERRVGGVVLFELTPLPAPAAIDRFERVG